MSTNSHGQQQVPTPSTVIAAQFIDPVSMKQVSMADEKTVPDTLKEDDLKAEEIKVRALQVESKQLIYEKEQLDEQIQYLKAELGDST